VTPQANKKQNMIIFLGWAFGRARSLSMMALGFGTASR
jgi:hypothetical protein